MLEKLKSFLLNDQIFFAIIVVLVGIASFSLGRASVAPSTQGAAAVGAAPQASVTMRELPETLLVPPQVNPTQEAGKTQTLVGSKSGTKYHLLTCPGAKQIKEENKIYFTDARAAEAAGYKPAANCPELP